MHFHVMDSPIEECGPGGEYEIEKASSHELEIRHKDLLPIIDNFPRATRSGWIDRSVPHTWLLFSQLHLVCSFFPHGSYSKIQSTNVGSVSSQLPGKLLVGLLEERKLPTALKEFEISSNKGYCIV